MKKTSKKEIIEGIKKVANKLGKIPNKNEYNDNREKDYVCQKQFRNLGYTYGSLIHEIFSGDPKYLEYSKHLGIEWRKSTEDDKAHIIEGIKKVAEKIGKIPNSAEYNQHREEKYLSNWSIQARGHKWKKLLNEIFPTRDKKDNSLNRSDLSVIKKNTEKTKRFFITAATAGANVDINFFQSMKTYCGVMNAELVILPMRGSGSPKETYLSQVSELSEHFATEYQLNSKLVAQDLLITPQQQRPLSGLDKLGQKEYSIIVASPKQHMKSVPRGSGKWPHVLYSTGAITEPVYKNDKAGKLAEQWHKIGGLVVEVSGSEFYIRQIQANKDGSFYDLNKKFTKNGFEESQAVGFTLGDLHVGDHDETAMRAWDEVIKLTKPKYLVLHDEFNGASINHHIQNDIDSRAKVAKKLPSLKSELDMTGKYLKEFEDKYEDQEVVIVASNHQEFLTRYLKEARYTDDPVNYRLALDLAILMHDGNELFRDYYRTIGLEFNNTTWLKRDESFKIEGIENGNHGDKGPNGSRGNPKSELASYGKSNTAHGHSPEAEDDSWRAGTSTKLKLSYTEGASSWIHTSILTQPGGARQMITSIKWNWKL
jgi:hypothetical protein